MPTTLRALIDLNVILDVLQRREPFFQDSAEVLAAAELGRVDGLLAAHSLTTLFYLLSKGESAERARVALTDLMQFLKVAAVDQKVLEQALNLPYTDFEDAVQMMAAVRAGARVLVTRNVQDFRHGPLPVLQPVEMLALLNE